MGKAIFFVKGSLLVEVLVKAPEAVKVEENRRFSNTCKLFSFLAKHNFLKDSCNTTLYLLDLIGFWPTFGLLHYAK